MIRAAHRFRVACSAGDRREASGRSRRHSLRVGLLEALLGSQAQRLTDADDAWIARSHTPRARQRGAELRRAETVLAGEQIEATTSCVMPPHCVNEDLADHARSVKNFHTLRKLPE